jgi:DNA modification methylase
VVIRDHRELGTVFTLGHVTSNGDHPAQFPVGLPYAYIAAFNGSVLDPFTGAGTTLIAAEQADLTGFGIEIAPSYCQVAIDRWEAFTGQRAVKVGEAVRA